MITLLALLALLFAPAHAQPFGGTVFCNSSVVFDASTNGNTTLVSGANSSGIYVCGYVIASQATVNAGLKYGQTVSTACDTGGKAMTPGYHFVANAPPIVDVASNYHGMFVPAGNDLCISLSAGSAVQAVVYFYLQKQ